VTAGRPGPLLRPFHDARTVHGETGLGGAVLPDSARAPRPGHAADFIIDAVSAAPGEITLVATGPLTNIALAVHKEPQLPSMVREFVIMGGSAGRGNVTPAAEYNMWADPEAASVVFGAGWTVRMIGLDVTLQALATAPVQERMRGLGALGSTLLLPALARYSHGSPPVHDVCAVASVAVPEVFGYTPAQVQVETTGRLTSGMTVTDFGSSQSNAQVATSIDVRLFWDVVLDAYAKVTASRG
jgi:purine nucleosidase